MFRETSAPRVTGWGGYLSFWWRDVQYSLPQTTAHVPAKHAMEQLLRLLSNGQADQQSQQSRSAAVLADEAAASEETGSEESHVDISPFAAQYCAAVAGQRGATPLEVLVNVSHYKINMMRHQIIML